MNKRINPIGFGDACLASLLVIVAFASRSLLSEYPNFKPIAAIALFSGFYFRNVWLALLVPVTAMLLSDALIGGYQWQIAIFVYGCFIASVFFGKHFVAKLESETDQKKIGRTSLAIAPLVTAVCFFLLTNFATWLFSGWYKISIEGFVACFVAAVPFFKYSLAGDMFFTWSLFCLYACLAYCTRRFSTRKNALI